MLNEDLAFGPAVQLRDLISTRQISPVDLTKLYLDRAESLNSKLNAFLTLAYDQAMKAATSAEKAVMRGDELGALHGLPVSIKDLEPTKGIRTTMGSLTSKDMVPKEDSVVVRRIKNAGAIVIGKTNTPEFGLSGTTENRLGDPCRNPWDTTRTTGGSSGGAAAAIVSGLCALSQGSDGGGSIRMPASFCGVYGFKSTQGRVPRNDRAGVPITANQFNQWGPITRTVRDAALMLGVMAGYDSEDPSSLRSEPDRYLDATERDIRGLRIAWSPDLGFAKVDSEVRETTEQAAHAFEDLGCRVSKVEFSIEPIFDYFWPLYSANVYAVLGPLLNHHADELTDYVREALEFGRDVTGADYSKALGKRDILIAQFTDLFENYDLLITPTMAVGAFPVGETPTIIGGVPMDEAHGGYSPFTGAINVAGLPAASIPCGFSSEGLPIGLHIVAGSGHDSTVFAASAAFEEAHPWLQHLPPVSKA